MVNNSNDTTSPTPAHIPCSNPNCSELEKAFKITPSAGPCITLEFTNTQERINIYFENGNNLPPFTWRHNLSLSIETLRRQNMVKKLAIRQVDSLAEDFFCSCNQNVVIRSAMVSAPFSLEIWSISLSSKFFVRPVLRYGNTQLKYNN